MPNDANNPTKSLVSNLVFGILGVGLVLYGRSSKPGLLTTISTTAGYSLIAKAVSSTVIATLKATEG
jgi:hypothetical protein